MLMAMLVCLGTAWGKNYYVYKNSTLYKYTGSETDYQAIIADTENFEVYVIPSQIELSTEAVVINIGTFNLTSITNNGILVNYGVLNCSSDITNNSTGSIINYGTITGGTITNSGTVTNTESGTIENSIDNNGTVENAGTISGTVTGEIDTGVYYWIGASDGEWAESSNWSYMSAGPAVVSGYPGSKNGDTAILAAGDKVKNLASAAAGYSLTIINSNGSSGGRVTIKGYGDNVSELKLTLNGYFLFDSCEAGTLTTEENSIIQITKYSAINDRECSYARAGLYVTGTLTIDSTSEIYSADTGEAEDIKPTLYAGGQVKNSGKIFVNNSLMEFHDDYTGYSGSTFTTSSNATFFFGNTTFNSGSTFTANDGTVYFFSSSEKTLKTFSGQTFNNLRFGGNVTIDASAGTLSAAYLGMHANGIEALYQTSSFTSKITGGSVSVTGDLQISRVSSSSTPGVIGTVIGTLELDNTELSSSTVTIHSGTELSLTSSSQLTSNSIQQQAADASYPNAIHNDGTITVTGTSASSLSIFGASETSRFTVDGSGRFVVSGGNDAFTGTNLSIGGDIKISDNSATVDENTFETTASVPATGVTYAQIMANGWKVSNLGIYRWKEDAASSDWSTYTNWEVAVDENTYDDASDNDYPNSTNAVVIIPDWGTGAKYPAVTSEDISVCSLTMGANATLTLGDANSDPYINFQLYGDYSTATTIGGTLIFDNCDFLPPDDCDITLTNIVINKFAEFEAASAAKIKVENATYNNSPKLESYITLTIPGGSLGELDLEGSGKVTVTSEMNVTGSTIIDGHLVIESGDFSTNNLEFNSDDDSFTPAASSTVTITGSWNNSERGTFNHNNSTVVFSDAGSGVSISGSENQEFYGFTVSGALTSDSYITILGNADFSACTALTDTSGADIDVHFAGSSEQNLTFDATSSSVRFKNFLISSTSSVKANGNFSLSGDFNAEGGTFVAESGLLSFTGGNTVYGANTFYSLAFTPGTTVKFEAGKKQTVNVSISSPGVSASTINLTSSASSPSKNDESTWWQLYMPNYDPNDITSSFPDFAYTNISYSRASSGTGSASQDLAHDWGSSVGEGTRDSTAGWFLTTFYWLGTSNSSWTTSANWAYSADASESVANYPSYDTGANSIIIATRDGGNGLTLSNAISVRSLTVKNGKSIDLKDCKVTANDSDATTSDFVIENEGSVRLYGTSEQISSTYSLGDDSTVEYYNDSASPSSIASLEFGTSYKNLKFGSGAKGSFSTALSVSGTTEIANGSGNALSLTGDNTFEGIVTLGNTTVAAGDITLSGDNTFTDGLTVTSAGKITLKGKADSSGGTLRIGSIECDYFEIQSDAEFTQGCTIGEFICQTAGTTLTFDPDSSGNAQTLTVTKITIKGEPGSEITLSGSESGGNSYKWNIDPDLSSSSNVSIAHAVIKNSKNLATNPIIVYAKGGYNIDGTGNTNWIFAGQEYVWLGEDSTNPTSWNQTSNWSPASVPQAYSSVRIPLVSSGKYPILESDLDLGSGVYSFDLDGDGTEETPVSSSITLSNGSQFDFAGFKLSVKSILFDSATTYSEIPGRIRVKGSEDLSGVTNSADVPLLGGIIEYYDDFGTSLIWGNSYSQLEFTDGAKGSSSDALSVSGRTLITNGSTNSISLTGDNTFTGPVSLGNSTMAAGDITLNGDNTFTGGLSIISAGSLVLKGKKDSSTSFTIFGDASCTLLTLLSPVIFQNTDSTQTLQTVDADTYFYGDVTAENPIAFTGDIKSNSSGEVKITSSDSGYILAKGSENRTFGAESGSLTFASDFYADVSSGSQISLSSDLAFEKNLLVYSGEISAGAVTLSVAKDFAIFGSSYSADDPRFAGDDTRFAYYGLENLSYQQSVFAASLSTAGTSFTVGGNLYANGLDLSNCSFSIPDNSASGPVFNPSAAVTEGQWGLPYAVLFNSTVTNCSVTCSDSTGSAFAASSVSQGVTDGSSGSGNTGFQFDLPKISGAYSVSDSVICLSFDMDLENSNDEVESAVAKVSSLAEGGIFYNGGLLAFDGIFYTKTDGTDCSIPLAESDWASTDIPAETKLYLKVSSADKAWNTDATASSSGNEDSSDRSGKHQSLTTDLSLFEGLFYAAKGKTMARNYGTGLWKDSGETSYTAAKVVPTIDKARPVLIDVLAGQELHTTSTGSAESQKPYDSHNFIELRYSEPVDIGDLPSGATSDNQNIQAQESFDSASSHGGAIIPDGSALTLAGFAQIASGSLTAGYRNGSDHDYDTAKAHSLYRKFSRYAAASEEVQPCRIRISVAGFVDEANPVVIDGKSFNNWIGFIDSSESPSGLVQPFANPFITDLATDNDGTALKNVFDEINASRTINVNEPSPSMLSDSHSVPGSETSLYGDWDCAHPVFAPYITSYNGSDSCSWNDGDSDTRSYELIGMVASNSDAYLDHVEFHLFDNAQRYSSSDTYKWISQIGWTENGNEIKTIVHSAPEHSGGEKQFSMTQNRTLGGIRRSSLADALAAFEYSYTLDEESSETRSFGGTEVSQKVKSLLFRNKDLTITSTDNDGLYLTLQLNDKDNALPIGTGFTVTYYPDKSFITDLAGNRLLQTDGGSKKTLHSVDITPPSFSVVLSPIGENKIYAVFTKPLAYGGTLLQDRSDLSSVLEKIRTNLEFVYSLEDKIDTDDIVSGEDAISIEKVELSSYSSNYTSLIFTLDRSIRLNDVEKIWLRVNDECEEVETFSGTIKASYFRDISENALPYHTCHAISDFAINAVNVLYGYSVSDQDEGWDEQGIYGSGVNSLSSDYAVHDFSEEGGNYAKLRSGHDIIFQLQLVGGVDSDGYYASQNGERLALVIDKKTNLRTEWISDKFNLLTGSDWRIWLDAKLYSIATDYNHNPLSGNPDFEDVTGSDLLKNMTITNDDYKFTNKEEYQFFFKICDSSGSPIMINHDGDKTTPEIPLYAFRMPAEKISSGDFSFLDLWSFTISSITSQRGGVTILNNVIDASVGEKTAIEVDMQSSGSLNVFVMTIDGNIVQRLSKGSVSAGKHYFYWDGKNASGNPVARGLYFVRVSGNGIDETRKVMVVK